MSSTRHVSSQSVPPLNIQFFTLPSSDLGWRLPVFVGKDRRATPPLLSNPSEQAPTTLYTLHAYPDYESTNSIGNG